MDLYHPRTHHRYHDHPTTGETTLGLLLLLIGVVLVISFPELRRYLRIRSM